jgi:signal transduction histidine kinase
MKSESSSVNSQVSKMSKMRQFRGWHKAISGIRPRILVWYFLLTASTVLVSIWVTRQMYCDRLQAQAEASLVQEIERFKLLANEQSQTITRSPATVTTLFEQFLSSYVPTRNEYIITLLNDQIYKSSPTLPPNLLKHHPNLVSEWTRVIQPQRGRLDTSGERINYVAQPVKIGSDRGTIVAIYDATADYQGGTSAIVLVIKVTLVFLVVFSVLAWVTAGRVLSPLRLLTKTAQSITESDMTLRIAVKGSDEIAELALTFNEMLDRLQFAFDSQQEFLKDASHELRTPITVIQGHLEMLHYQPERQQETIALVMDELSRMSRLVNELLLLAKAERPDFLKLKPEELDWLTEEIYLKARTLANRDWRLESKGLSPVLVDRQRLTQAVMNLVENAVRHTQDRNTITLGSAVKEDYAYIWVRDTGEGIAPEDQERIFDRFVRATNDNQQFEGSGLGLSIVKAIAQAHGGWVELKSRLGYGSTFTIVIPLVSSQDVAVPEQNPHHLRQSPHPHVSGNQVAGKQIRDSSR